VKTEKLCSNAKFFKSFVNDSYLQIQYISPNPANITEEKYFRSRKNNLTSGKEEGNIVNEKIYPLITVLTLI